MLSSIESKRSKPKKKKKKVAKKVYQNRIRDFINQGGKGRTNASPENAK